MSKRVAILQSNYIPWKGYFDLINAVDEFVLYDTAQFTKNDWRNRNKIKTPQGVSWLTIPVVHRFGQPILETVVANQDWAGRHWATLSQIYAKARCFGQYRSMFEGLYSKAAGLNHLSQINHLFLIAICKALGIQTRITWSQEYELADGQTERLVSICSQLGASEYVSGPAAKTYLNPAKFEESGICIRYIDYSGYAQYNQLHPPFQHQVSIVDLLCNEGRDAPSFMKSFGSTRELLER